MIRVGKVYAFGRNYFDGSECVFVVVAEEPYKPRKVPSGYIPGPGFRVLLLEGEVQDAIHGPTKAGEEMLVGASSAIACDSEPYEGA